LLTIVVIYVDGLRHWKGDIEFGVIVISGCVEFGVDRNTNTFKEAYVGLL
jgi:hypothetical protein